MTDYRSDRTPESDQADPTLTARNQTNLLSFAANKASIYLDVLP